MPGLEAGAGPGGRPVRSAGLLLLALLATLWIFLANGGVLFYFDTASYVERGQEVLALAGVEIPALEAAPRDDLGGTIEPDPEDGPATVDGSRSMVYSLLTGLFVWAGALEGMVLLNAALAVLAVWLPVRVALRLLAPGLSPAAVTLAAILPAALGSLPFYVAFLMPDILAPALLLAAATLAAFAPRMRGWELALAFGLGALAVTVHLSHLAIGVLLVPLVTLVALLAGGPRRWLGPLLMLAIVGTGVAEQAALRLAARAVEDGEVVYRPFLTARLIQDGPGLAYLGAECPDRAPGSARAAEEPACALLGFLAEPGDPERLKATNIVFDTSPEKGSYRLLDLQAQRDIAVDQFDFFLDVLRDRPIATTWAFAGNALRQTWLDSVDMTLQSDAIVARAANLPGLLLGRFDHGRLTADRSWLAWADPLQGLLYAASALAILAAVLSRRTPGPLRAFLVMTVLGILVNAIVCGGISQPATRYGARVIWLLPAAAALAGAVLWATRDRRAAPALGRAGA